MGLYGRHIESCRMPIDLCGWATRTTTGRAVVTGGWLFTVSDGRSVRTQSVKGTLLGHEEDELVCMEDPLTQSCRRLID
eukprot:4112915-Pleurochrysis_carterae.AAC.1